MDWTNWIYVVIFVVVIIPSGILSQRQIMRGQR